jgi:hypothetical protein
MEEGTYMRLRLQKYLIAVHKDFLNRSRECVSKEYEGFFVLMLRCCETFIKPLALNDSDYWYGMTEGEIEQITVDHVAKIYQALISYYVVVLDGERVPGIYRERVQLALRVCETTEFVRHIEVHVPQELDPHRRIVMTTTLMATTIAQILGASAPDEEQIFETLLYSATYVIGPQAARSHQRRCFVASSAFESELDPTVDALRRHRDEVLIHTPLGGAFVAIYNRVGPILARVLDAVPVMKPTVRFLLRSYSVAFQGRTRTPTKFPSQEPGHPRQPGGYQGNQDTHDL